MKRPQYPWDSQFTPQKNTHFFILFEMSWPPKKLVRENSVELEWNGEIHKESFQSSVVSANLSNTHTPKMNRKNKHLTYLYWTCSKSLTAGHPFITGFTNSQKPFKCTWSKHGKKKKEITAGFEQAQLRKNALKCTYLSALLLLLENTKMC
jgi:hypothetical protein